MQQCRNIPCARVNSRRKARARCCAHSEELGPWIGGTRRSVVTKIRNCSSRWGTAGRHLRRLTASENSGAVSLCPIEKLTQALSAHLLGKSRLAAQRYAQHDVRAAACH